MGYQIEISDIAEKELKKMDKPMAKRVLNFLYERVEKSDNPRRLGKQLQGSLRDFWRYRVGDYRIICSIEDKKVTVFVLTVAHRSEIYSD